MTDIGITANTQEARDWGKLERTIAKVQPSWSLLMHGGESHKLRPHSPSTDFIQREDANDGAERFMPKLDGKDNPKYESPEAYYNRRTKQVNERDFILPFNEIPFLWKKEYADRWNEYNLDLMARAVKGGRRFAIGTIPTTTLEPHHWPALKPTIDMVAAHPDLFVMTFTEYAAGVMHAGVNGTYPPNWKDDQGKLLPAEGWYRFNPAEWPKQLDLTKRQYMIGRYTDMLKIPGLTKLPRGVVIETWLDNVDVKAWRETLVKRPGYSEMRGWRSYREQYQAWIKGFPPPFNTWSWVKLAAYGLLWARDVAYAPFGIVECIMPFMWTTNQEWVDGFDTSHPEADEMWDIVAEDRAAHHPLPKPWSPAQIPNWGELAPPAHDLGYINRIAQTKGMSVNVYQYSHLDAPVVAKIESGDEIGVNASVVRDDLIAVRVGGKVGWASTKLLWFVENNKPENPPAPDHSVAALKIIKGLQTSIGQLERVIAGEEEEIDSLEAQIAERRKYIQTLADCINVDEATIAFLESTFVQQSKEAVL